MELTEMLISEFFEAIENIRKSQSEKDKKVYAEYLTMLNETDYVCDLFKEIQDLNEEIWNLEPDNEPEDYIDSTFY